MGVSDMIRCALKNIKCNKLRAFLTMLGIIVGISSVMIILGLGSGTKQYITDSFTSLGTRMITIMLPGNAEKQIVTVDDMYDIVERNADVLDLVSPMITVSEQLSEDIDGTEQTTVLGISEDFILMDGSVVDEGRSICYMDLFDMKHICLIGDYVNDVCFSGNGLGETLEIGGQSFLVVGIIKEKTTTIEPGDADDQVYLPYTTAMQLFGGGNDLCYYITTYDESLLENAKETVSNELYELFQDHDAYQMVSMGEILDTLSNVVSIVVIVLAIIAGISLLVGGIGIMNIMLVTVTERTKEIGLRKAIGAKEKEILRQFVVESGATSAIGGVIGIICGYLLSGVASVVVSSYLGATIVALATPGAVVLSFGISVAVGVLFGALPAKKAAKLNPIDALRYN